MQLQSAATMDLENIIQFAKDKTQLEKSNQDIKGRIDIYDGLITKEDEKIANSKQSDVNSKSLYEQWQLALNVSNAVQTSKNQYISLCLTH